MKFAGGFFKKYPKIASTGTASWSWYDQGRGLVVWTLRNLTDQTRSFVLFRNGYYFGNAYWPIYEANAGFDVKFASELTPLPSGKIEENGAPLAVIDLGMPATPLQVMEQAVKQPEGVHSQPMVPPPTSTTITYYSTETAKTTATYYSPPTAETVTTSAPATEQKTATVNKIVAFVFTLGESHRES